MKLLEGKKIQEKMLRDLKVRIKRQKRKPALAVVLVGNDKASEIYVSLKQRAAGAIDMDFWVLNFSARDTERDILQAIQELNEDESIDGIIVQLPLPEKFNAAKIVNAVDPKKDADGFSPRARVAPVFPAAIIKLIESSRQKLSGKKALVIANSAVFGKAMTAALEGKKILAKYILSEKLKGESKKLKEADIVITAVGKPGVIKGSMLKSKAIVIDGGISKRGKRVLGDVDFQSVKKENLFLSPVPGGVGPVTIACLLENVWKIRKK